MIDDIHDNIAAAEERIAYNSFETAILFDRNFNEVFRAVGDTRVRFTKEQRAAMPGNILTHNHPYRKTKIGEVLESSFSIEDARLSFDQELHILRMVYGAKVHSLMWNESATVHELEKLCILIGNLNDKVMARMRLARETSVEAMHQEWQNGTKEINDQVHKYAGMMRYTYYLRRRRDVG